MKPLLQKIFSLSGMVKGAVFLLVFANLLFWVATKTQFLECLSESLQGVRYLIVVKDTTCARGNIVSIQGHNVAHIQEGRLAKRILGLPGDAIWRQENSLCIQSVCLPLLKQTKDGKPLTPISARLVPDGYAFVAGDHPRSFDSRYEEFGLVPLKKIWGRAIWWR